jgi:hypothetical protein
VLPLFRFVRIDGSREKIKRKLKNKHPQQHAALLPT